MDTAQADHYIKLYASLGRDLVARIRDEQGLTGDDNKVVASLLAGNDSEFAGLLSDDSVRSQIAVIIQQQLAIIEGFAAAVEKSDAEVSTSGATLQSGNVGDYAAIAAYVLVPLLIFSSLVSIKIDKDGTNVTIPNQQFWDTFLKNNSLAALINAFRKRGSGDREPPAEE
ncbi:hypothetical protein GR248_24330 [Rhizobium leguminosarum]|uniref:hypothetical protein n=1 Tax=Rhizobium leguminosarum TaxID=384 RepID=UPI0013C5B8F4|nr:hypothetical protein [Rhizobium leguminosarum]NEI93928.1 hypothetical protein [Rhizobium leguminosarum]